MIGSLADDWIAEPMYGQWWKYLSEDSYVFKWFFNRHSIEGYKPTPSYLFTAVEIIIGVACGYPLGRWLAKRMNEIVLRVTAIVLWAGFVSYSVCFIILVSRPQGINAESYFSITPFDLVIQAFINWFPTGLT